MVSFALNGYLPQSVPVQAVSLKENWDNAEAGSVSEQVNVSPNPVFAQLEKAPPPPAPPAKKKKPAPKKQPVASSAPPPG